MLKRMIQAEWDQNADCSRIEAAVRLAEQDFVSLCNRQLDTEEKRKKWNSIRDRTILAVRDVRHNMHKRANEAKRIQACMIKMFFQEREAEIKHSKLSPSEEYLGSFQDSSTKGLLDHLRYLVRIGDLIGVQRIRVTFKRRDDRHRYAEDFDEILAQFVFAQSGDLGERLTTIRRLAEEADSKITELFCRPIDQPNTPGPSPLKPVPVSALHF
jgi:hypothetical protein